MPSAAKRKKKKMNNPSKTWAKNLNRHLTKGGIWMASKHTKRRFTLYVIREMQIKTTRYHYTPIRMAKIWNTYDTKCCQGCGATELSLIAGGNAKCTATLEDSLAASYKTKHTFTITTQQSCSLVFIYTNELKTYFQTKTCS